MRPTLISAFVCALSLASSLPAQVSGLGGTLVVTNKTPSTATIIDVATGRNTVSQLDLGAGAFTRGWDVPAQPEAINVTPDGGEVWVGSNATGKVSVIDVATSAITTVADSVQWPYRVLFTPDVATAIIPDLRGETVRFLDRATKRELGRIPFAGAAPQGITITADGRYVFQSLSAHGRVAVIDVAKRAVVGYLAAGQTPDGIAYTARTFTPRS